MEAAEVPPTRALGPNQEPSPRGEGSGGAGGGAPSLFENKDDPDYVPRTCWEPAKESRQVAFEAESAMRAYMCMSRRGHEAITNMKRDMGEAERCRAEFEMANMSYHDIWGSLLAAVDEWIAACKGTREALAFSWQTLAAFDSDAKEDWRQSYDPFEDGNNWRQVSCEP